MKTITFSFLALTACFSPIPQTETTLRPVSVLAPETLDAGVVSVRPELAVPATPVTDVIDALAPNPPATISDGSDQPMPVNCRGDDYLRDVRKPQQCVDTGCLVSIGSDRQPRVLDLGTAGFQVVATSATRTAWIRQNGQTSVLMVGDGVTAPRRVASMVSASATVLFDGDDVLLVEAVSSSDTTWTRITRYADGQPESSRRLVMEVPGRVRQPRLVAVHPATGRVWALTSVGLFFSAPRMETGNASEVPLDPDAAPTAFALLPGGSALVATGREVWLTSPPESAQRLDHLATFPERSNLQAIAPFGAGFVAIASSEVFVLEGAGPIRRVLGRTEASPYASTEPALVVSGRKVLISTLCLSWSSYPGYDVAVLDPDAKTAQWWWQAYPSQWEVPAFPVARANVGSNNWSSVEVHRAGSGFVTTSLP
ncbi:MAG: hypothetical protein Q8S33_28235 [Myxococcales bacterium]|nr:hypothetical protein [Myxococcales bacterium]